MTAADPSARGPRTPSQVRLPQALRQRIREAAERAYPDEGCGLLVGRHTGAALLITDVADSANVAEPPRRDRFEVDPAVRFALMRRLRGSDLAIVGHWHSHPDGPAAPSARDQAMVFEPELLWVIVAVHVGRPTEMAAFVYEEASSGFRRLPIAGRT